MSAEQRSSVRVLVRPFRAFVGDAPVEMRGAIVDGRFVLGIFGRDIELPATVESDDGGQYALLEADEDSELVVEGGLSVQVRVEFEEDVPPGGEIRVLVGAPPAARPHSSEIILLEPDPRPSYSVYFESDGRVEQGDLQDAPRARGKR